ncbi:MAG TPA: hypothetical protein VJ464_21410 [Blastocatellia bacterium]|nr:hypothetical protein [Blastocatellia bacterium]
MFKAWRFIAIPLLMALACAAVQAQSQSKSVRGQYEREFVPRPARSLPTQNRLFFAVAPGKSAKARAKAITGGTLTTALEPEQIHIMDAPGGGVSWPQWGHDASHSGSINVVGQSPNQVLADIVYDPFVEQEKASGENVFGEADLFVHYQTPLVDGNDVFMEFKSGTYTDLTTWETQTWNQRRLNWQNGHLVQVWNFQSDWKPVPFGGPFWEPVYHGVLAGNFFYDPGFGGTVYKLNRANGSVVARYNPFGNNVDANTYVAGPLTADSAGNVYYNAIKLANNNPWGKDVVGAWLVKIAANGTISKVAFSALTPGAPAATDQCKVQFANSQLPWPPSPDAVPTTINCGSQRPGINVAPAVASDGTIYTISRTHFATRYGYLVAVNPDLTLKWSASLRDHLNDGCGVPVSLGGQLPPNGAPGGCRVGAHLGVDPGTNESGPGRVLDDSTSSPVVAPDGSVYYGAYTLYNYAQGHMMHFDAAGNFLNAFRFGWDITPGIYAHDGTYSVITKDNHYGGGSYCGVEQFCPEDRNAQNSDGYPEAYFVSSLSPNLTLEWAFQNTNTLSCTRQPNGSVTCVSDHPRGFEWCVNAPAIDSHGVVYANSEDGNMFTLNPDGTLKKKIFQQLAIGAAYTPASLGADGKIYSQNDGHLYVIGNTNAQASKGGGLLKIAGGKQ